MGRITVVTSGKGGSGKTTTSAAIGSVFAKAGKSVLLVDGDAGMRSLDSFVGVTQKLVFDISDVFNGICEPIRAIYSCGGPKDNLFILPAPSSIDKLVPAKVMRRLMKGLSQYYDEIVIDCPAGIGEGFDAAVAAADLAVVVTTPDPVCVRDAAIVRAELEKRGISEKYVLINKYSRTFLQNEVIPDLDYVIDTSGLQLIGVVPQDSNASIEAGKGLSATPGGEYAKAYERIGRRLMGQKIPLGKIEKF